jgi:hypothetical protein
MQIGLKMGERPLDALGRGRVQIVLAGEGVREAKKRGIGLGRGRCGSSRGGRGGRFVTARREQRNRTDRKKKTSSCEALPLPILFHSLGNTHDLNSAP